MNRLDFYEAAIIALEATVRWGKRYANLAKEMAEKEGNPQRRKELKQIAENCARVPGLPPRTFHEALQSFWFIFLVVQQGTASVGRFDQYMYPFYQRDIEAGKITAAEALELLQLLRIKDMHLISTPLRGVKRRARLWTRR